MNRSLTEMINAALEHDDPAVCNRAITEAHYRLSGALADRLGPDSGANFHSWAVWGSKKAGVTIRQEDLDTALTDATRAGAVSGLAVGLAVARSLGGRFWYPLGASLGPASGALAGRFIARWSRRKAARLVLQGNRLVLDDIGRQTARFCQEFVEREGLSMGRLEQFCSQVEQPLLAQAFHHYGMVGLSRDLEERHQHGYFANILAILHEHQKLQPYIASSMPFVVKRCVTKRLMKFEIGPLVLSVSEDVPALSEMRPFPDTLERLRLAALIAFLRQWDRTLESASGSKAHDWSRIEQRMGYIVNLFRRFHTDRSVLLDPFEV